MMITRGHPSLTVGDKSEILALYERYRLPLYRYAYRMTGSAGQAAEDLVHDCFVELLRGKVPFQSGELRAYLFGVVRMLYRRRFLRGQPPVFDDLAELPALNPEQLAGVEMAERGAAVARALNALPPLQREALVLFEYEELSLEEIAQIAEVEVGTIKARLYRARENMRRQLAPLLERSRIK